MFSGFVASVLGWIPPPIAKRLSTWKQSSPLAQRLFAPFIGSVTRTPVEILRGPAAGLRMHLAGTSVGTLLGINEPEVVNALVESVPDGGTLYDLGANVGYITLVGARLVGRNGRVCAFEPIPETAAVLRENVALNRLEQVTVHELAVSDSAGRTHFEIGEDSVRARAVTAIGDRGTVEVELVALDTLIEAGAIPPPHFIKMDIEGAEVAALEGLRETLRVHQPGLLIEVHGTQRQVVALLRAAGYEVTAVEADGPAESVPDYTHVLAMPRARAASVTATHNGEARRLSPEA